MPAQRLRIPCARPPRRTGLIVLAWCALASTVGAQHDPALPAQARAVLDRFAGTWQVAVSVKKPRPAQVSYVLHNAWVLDGHFIQGDTGVKSDGTHELSMLGYDRIGKAYPLWIFYGSGLVAYLPQGRWDEETRTMSWRSAPADPVQYGSRCRFEGDTVLRCATQVGDGRGGTAIEFESVARRR